MIRKLDLSGFHMLTVSGFRMVTVITNQPVKLQFISFSILKFFFILNWFLPRFVILGGCLKKDLASKAQNLCDVTQYVYAECQVTKFIYIVPMILVTTKCHFSKGNNQLISASILEFFTILKWEGLKFLGTVKNIIHYKKNQMARALEILI